MTNNQLLYSINTKKSKVLCLRMERLIEDADYFEKSLDVYRREMTVYELWEVKLELESIWDAQIDLFYKIQAEHTKQKTDVFMESIRYINKRSSTMSWSKNY